MHIALFIGRFRQTSLDVALVVGISFSPQLLIKELRGRIRARHLVHRPVVHDGGIVIVVIVLAKIRIVPTLVFSKELEEDISDGSTEYRAPRGEEVWRRVLRRDGDREAAVSVPHRC